jgi:Protein of unknown function (DUF3592)
MSGGAIFILIVVAAFPTLILVAAAVKLWEVHKAKSWLSVSGKVIASRVESSKKKPGDPGYDFNDTEVSNVPFVEYEYNVGNRTHRCHRITIGEKTADFELEEILARYPVGASVTVFYNPANPQQAVLERDLPAKMMFWGLGCLMLFFIGGPLIAVFSYFNAVDWLKKHIADPTRAPFVAAASGFALVALWFTLAFQKMVRDACKWPVTRGKIIAAEVEAYQGRVDTSSDTNAPRTFYKPSVVYTYRVNGRQFQGDRVTIGTKISATMPGVASRLAKRYPVGTEVDVHYNPKSPGESVLRPRSMTHWLLWVVVIAMFTLAWAVATGRLG